MPLYLLSEIPNMEDKFYLELGVYDSHHFNSVSSRSKISVDLNHPAMFNGTTDKYFESIGSGKKFDVVYIDADHHHNSISKDFNNSVERLNDGGAIFLHDMFPQSEELTAPHFCGSGYIFLDALIRSKYADVYTMNDDYGQTFVFNPSRKIYPIEIRSDLSYRQFRSDHKNHKLYSKEELQGIVREKFNG